MVDKMTLDYLFFLGILIPTIVTVAIFIVFLVYWHRYRVRQQIINTRHDPHGRFKSADEKYGWQKNQTPPSMISGSSSGRNNNRRKTPEMGDYEETPEPIEMWDNPRLYKTAPDSGFSDFTEIKCKTESDCDKQRPSSQASTDSEDSGFRSSRSGPYIHSACNSNVDQTKELVNCGHMCTAGGMTKGFPVFKPIQLHPSDSNVQLHVISVPKDPCKGISSEQQHHTHRRTAGPSLASHSDPSSPAIQLCAISSFADVFQQRNFNSPVINEIPMQFCSSPAMIKQGPVMMESSLYSVV